MQLFDFQILYGVLMLAICAVTSSFGQKDFQPNYDESKVGEYKLPELLVMRDGSTVKNAKEWNAKRRPEILDLFSKHVYGVMPSPTPDISFKVIEENKKALDGLAVRKQVRIYFDKNNENAYMDVLLYIPSAQKKPVPVFIGLNFFGNHTVHADRGIKLSESWVPNNKEFQIEEHKATEMSRAIHDRRWPVEELLKSGYAVATAYCGDLEPDHVDGWKTGIRSSLKEKLNVQPNEWSAMSAWAWGLSRMVDYLVQDKQINSKQIVVTGHSRLGKAALWSAANDTRMAIVVSNDSGEGGAALARRNFGETVERINTSFPYWFVDQYKTYNKNESAMLVDQHMLLALMAPRPLYVASAEDDEWADPFGEFLGLKNAGPAYALFGIEGIKGDTLPPVEVPVGDVVRYHIRKGAHDITLYDWQQYIKHADSVFKK